MPDTEAYEMCTNFSNSLDINDNASARQARLSHGRDQNLNNGSGPMTINTCGLTGLTIFGTLNIVAAERRRVPSPRFGNNSSGAGPSAMNNYDSDGEERRGPGDLTRSSNTSFANSRRSSGKPLTPENLRREENAFRQLLDDSEQYEDLLTVDGEDAQEVLNRWQRLSECINDTELQSQIVHAIIKLSDNSGLFPECLWIGENENLGKRPAEVGVFADIWMGNISGVKVAVKVVRHRIDVQKYEHSRKAFVRKVMVWRSLNHPSVLPLTGMYWLNGDPEQICLVSPWMENGNLLQYLRGHPELSPETHISLAKDIAQGLAYLHDLNIIHGDLKGHNILITPDRTACITLALSRAIGAEEVTELSTASSCWRPVRWLAPEQLRSGVRSIISPESDIYAFGCVCYEIYARSIPFEDVEEYRIYYVVAVQKRHPEPPPQAPGAMQRLMESCWSAEPGSRPKAVDVVDEIRRVQEGHAGLSLPAGRPRRGNVQDLFGGLYDWLLGWLMSLV
ncbi:hypothetical protein AAF712_003617 [Marasmius tenuissimus]|uniref:Protein kinase domain-containing protein n=1 Tax=Marasmius tenuissimus TaxID=585030 RepID=A0ABR3A6H2_9AGAR